MVIRVKIKPFTESVLQVDLDLEATVLEFKDQIGQLMGQLKASDIKLVYSGQILKDEDQCSTYGIASGHTIYLVRSSAKKKPPQEVVSASGPAANTANTANTTVPSLSQPPPTSFSASPFSAPGGMMGMDPSFMNSDSMRSMMNSPAMQGLLSNPDFVRSILMSNPQMQALVEQNPEIGHMINNPSFLQQSMEMMRNPELMREMQRNNDRALSNIEALPGGFNHLQRLYSTFQAPLGSALDANPTSSDEANERMAREMNVSSVPENQLNTQALPNPWAQSASTHSTTTTTTTSTMTNTNNNNNNNNNPLFMNPLAHPGMSQGFNPFSSLLGNPTGAQNPSMPAHGATPTNNPTTDASLPLWAQPDFVQASMRLTEMLRNPNVDPSNPLQWDGSMGMNNAWNPSQMSSAVPQAPLEPPETRFSTQLGQLADMGFSDKQANVRALLATGGNVQAAVEYLFNN